MSKTRIALIIVASAALGVSALVATGSAASAKTVITSKAAPETMSIVDSGPRRVTTTKHVHAKLSFEAIRHGAAPGLSDAGRKSTLAITLKKGAESHTWQFILKGGSFTDNGATGRGHISTGTTQIKPYGAAAITFSAIGAGTTTNCGATTSKVTHRLQLHGTLRLKTHSRWGNWSGKIKLFHGLLQSGHGTDYPEACVAIPCQAGVSWDAAKGQISIVGATVGSHGTMTANRRTKLSMPRHAARFDQVAIRTPAPQTSAGALPSLLISAPSGPVSGSARLKATSSQPYGLDCTGGSLTGTQWQANFTQGPSPLTFHEKVFGSITLPSLAGQDLRSLHVATPA